MDNSTLVPATLEGRIFQIVVEESEQPREKLDRDTALADHLDSLARIELVMALEDEFELSIPDEETEKIITIGHLIDEVEARLSRKRQGIAATATTDEHAAPGN